MSKPKIDKEISDRTEIMFDFLQEDAANRPRRPQRGQPSAAPIIRKPVPIEKLGGIAETGLPPGQNIDEEEFSFLQPEKPKRNQPDIDFDDDWHAHVHKPYEDEDRSSRWRVIIPIMGILILGAGGFFARQVWLGENPLGFLEGNPIAERFGFNGERVDTTDSAEPVATEATQPTESSATVESAAPLAVKPLSVKFREELVAIEAMVDSGQYDEARKALDSMDRVVYGYGAPEFGALEVRINELAGADDAAAAEAAAQKAQAAAQEAQREAAARAEADKAAREAEAKAAEERAERQRQADAEAAQRQAEADKQAAANRRAEQQRAEQERAAAVRQAEAQRQSAAIRQAEDAARARAEARAAAQARAEAANNGASSAAPLTTLPAIPPSASVNDSQVAAGAARVREAEQGAQIQQAELATQTESTAQANVVDENFRSRPITDDDLQIVYSRFVALEDAIGARDINEVIRLTKPSGVRVQQFLQVFENTDFINSRIANVATRNADGAIVGRLIIESLVRADGSVVNAPSSISSIRLTSTRGPDGWSVIDW